MMNASEKLKKTETPILANRTDEEKPKIKTHLLCRTPFRNYTKGSIIKDEEEVNAIMNCHENVYVNKLLSVEG